ncbi:hypothetical protein HNY73_018601 [Argiope bruennichi]|uniref:Uncharacterized protein n=1 Tax=Argiope bruennichi TaxID=94029 RepID=A0A8T0EEA9_ARGBR|nr:hypothetical protein HNY73_018601 [Argiope bruennichi]
MEVQSATNFSMLTERLHILFKRYIINGRVRAPPEFELKDMIPTFQQGAKTNRRALQSKFKSWAKRMTVISGNLVLSSSGKVIIPQERCEEIIMEFHRDNHMGINKIITQVFLVNKTPKKTYLLVPPSYKAYLNSAKKTIPVSDGKQPIAPRISSSDKVSLKYKTVSQELHQRRLNNAIFGKANYSSKQKELNVGITLVKGVRNALIEIEKNEDNIVEDAV